MAKTIAVVFFVVVVLASSIGAVAPDAVVRGVITSRGGIVPLGGVVLTLSEASGRVVATVRSGADGRFGFPLVSAGRYRLRTSALDMVDAERNIELSPRQELILQIELDLLPFSETVQVTPAALGEGETTIGSRPIPAQVLLDEAPLPTGRIEEALALFPGVIKGPGGVGVRGGWRIAQTSVQIDTAYAVDPSTGNKPLALPADALSSIEVLGTPYTADLGRFSAGVTVFHTQRGGDTWHTMVNGLMPSFRVARENQLRPTGIDGFAPRLAISGPIVKNRVFLAQSAQYFYSSSDVRSRPVDELNIQREWRLFTRVDAALAAGHTLTARVTGFHQRLDSANLSTFNPPEVTFDIRQWSGGLAVSENSMLGNAAILESTLYVSHYNVRVDAHGDRAMQIAPQGNSGSFFNTQRRWPWTHEWGEAYSRSLSGKTGEHLLRMGFDVLHASYRGTSVSRDVEIRRLDGTLARRITFGPPTSQREDRTDAAGFIEDRWRVSPTVVVELGLRFDRDGVLGTLNSSPRAGLSFSLARDGSSRVYLGAGAFCERTPLIVAAFSDFERRTETRFGLDGATRLAPPITYSPRSAEGLQTPYASTWTVGYDRKIGAAWSFAAHYLDRRGSHELVLQPVVDRDAGELRLTSDGRSRYRSVDVMLNYKPSPRLEVTTSYTHAFSRADLNAYTSFFGTDRTPLIWSDEYARPENDVPSRFLLRGRVELGSRWLVVPVLDLRTGFPYSAVDGEQQFVGARNEAGRFPTQAVLNLSIERRARVRRWNLWYGVRLFNVLNVTAPVDVQQNITAPDFGQTYGSVPFQYRFNVRFSR